MTKQPNPPFIIAIDGPAASGKGTLARRIAAELGISYMDTGKLYRALGWNMMSNHEDIHDAKTAVAYAKKITVEDTQNTHLYDERVGKSASIISAIPEVREALLECQRNFARTATKGAVLDGRDIGTIICPDAQVKLFVTANIEARADRRFAELSEKDPSVTREQVLDNLSRRDYRDSRRTIAPLAQADDAIFIDTTNMSADEAFAKAMSAIKPQFSRYFA